jgi:hypothetical protein
METEILMRKLKWYNEFGCYIKVAYPEVHDKASDWADTYINIPL